MWAVSSVTKQTHALREIAWKAATATWMTTWKLCVCCVNTDAKNILDDWCRQIGCRSNPGKSLLTTLFTANQTETWAWLTVSPVPVLDQKLLHTWTFFWIEVHRPIRPTKISHYFHEQHFNSTESFCRLIECFSINVFVSTWITHCSNNNNINIGIFWRVKLELNQ